MADTIIDIENLGKKYRLGRQKIIQHLTLRETLVERSKNLGHTLIKPFGAKAESPSPQEFWALKNVSFEVKQGEVVGVIGRNGAGKSTLLKLLSRITAPTTGRISLGGRVSSLLEVGTGFHPELTGRENIYLNGAILGMSRAELRHRFKEIVAFAEIEKFLDTPVKRYSSGMYMRLAFAVAAHLEPEILLIDEVLAVGDAAFQKKCLGKIGSVAKGGRTVLFVSHNLVAVKSLCQRVIWLHNSQIIQDGPPEQVIDNYLNHSFSSQTEQCWPDLAQAPGNEKVRLQRACVRPLDGKPSDPITNKTPFILEFSYWNLEPETYLSLSMELVNEEGVIVFVSDPVTEPDWHGRSFPAGLFQSRCYVPGDLLNDGTYTIQLYIVKDQSIDIHCYEELLSFEVREISQMQQYSYHKWPGTVRPNLRWETELVNTDLASFLS